MKISVVGAGYVGLVTAACFSEMGNAVVCMDNDLRKIAMLKEGQIPIYEPGLDEMIVRNAEGKRLVFTDRIEEAVNHALAIFIAVGTPPQEDGSADLKYVCAVAKSIGSLMSDYKIIVVKSTVPVGTCYRVRDIIRKALDERGVQVEFDVVSNPEFLKEGTAIGDCMKPDRVVVGSDNVRVGTIMKELYRSFMRREENFIGMDVLSAELTKYAANAMLATKISFMNEIANICERVGANVEHVRIGIGSDSRIGYSFIYPGLGYGGSCFPKDVKALISTAASFDYEPRLLRAVENINEDQKRHLVVRIKQRYGADLSRKTFALWGVSFKPDTDDIREAPALAMAFELIAAGATIRAYDPVALENVIRELPANPRLILNDDQYDVLQGADALLIATEWKQFRNPDFEQMKERMAATCIFDGRNLYNPQDIARYGFTYISIGR